MNTRFSVIFRLRGALFALLCLSPLSALEVHQESAGLVVIEAEHTVSRTSALSVDWVDVADGTAVGGTAIQASPDTGVYSNTTTSPRADYQVNFTEIGTYYLWVRLAGPSTSSDSVHAGYKSVPSTISGGLTSAGSSAFMWGGTEGSTPVTFEVTSLGINTVNLWMREDGVKVDRLILTDDPAYTPSGTGPAESERVERPVISSAATAAGSVGTLLTYRITAPQPVDSYAATGLPAGLVLDPASGEIEGRPTATGTYNATVTATNRGGSDDNALTITVTAAPTAHATAAAFKAALDSAVAGDVIVLADNTYTDFGYYKIDNVGTASAPIVVRAQTPGEVIFNGNVQFEVTGNHIILDGFRFNGDARPSPDYAVPASKSGVFKITGEDNRLTECSINGFNRATGLTKWVQLKGARNRVDHCHFSNKVGPGQIVEVVLDGTADHHRIDHNAFRDFAYGGGANEYETVRIGSGTLSIGVASESIVEHNHFEACDGEGETISIKSSDCIVRHNTLIDCRGSITLRQGAGNLVEGNVMLNLSGLAEAGGIRVCGSDHEIRDNYIQGTRSSGKHLGGINLVASDVDPAASPSTYGAGDHWPVRDVLVQNNSFINCQQSFIYGGSNYAHGPVSVDFIDNCARNNLGGDGQFDIVRLLEPIATAGYAGERYYGSPTGLASPLHAGIDATNDPALTTTVLNGYTFYFAPGGSGTDATLLQPLQATDVGPRDYTP
ncbi:MAG: chondroitinase-B domain-containing protein [Verrucomicrobiota bacterium]